MKKLAAKTNETEQAMKQLAAKTNEKEQVMKQLAAQTNETVELASKSLLEWPLRCGSQRQFKRDLLKSSNHQLEAGAGTARCVVLGGPFPRKDVIAAHIFQRDRKSVV